MFTLSFSLLSFYPLIHLSRSLERPAQLTCLNSHLSIPSIPMWVCNGDLVHWARSPVQASIHCPPQFPAPPYLQVLTLFLPHRHFRHVVSFLQLRGIQCSFYIPYLLLLFFHFHVFPVQLISLSQLLPPLHILHPSLLPSPLTFLLSLLSFLPVPWLHPFLTSLSTLVSYFLPGCP